jgi:hypothetical protein
MDDAWDPRADEADAALERLLGELQPGDTAFAEHDHLRRWTGAVVVVSRDPDVQVVDIGDGVGVPGRVTIRRGTTTVVVDSTGGRPAYTVTVQTTSAALLKRLHLAELVEQALGHVTVTTRERPRAQHRDPSSPAQAEWLERYGLLPVGERMANPEAARRYVRSDITDRDVERAAQAYRDGGIAEVRRVMHVGERQAWRYVERAQDTGLVERKRAKRRTGGTT